MGSASICGSGRLTRPLAALVAILVLATAAPVDAAGKARPVKVMTRNVYVGASFGEIVTAARSCGAQANLECIVGIANATAAARAAVDQTNFPARAQLLADEIAEADPALIGLQEVALWRSGPLELHAAGVSNALTVDYDYLAILLDALAARGLSYDVVVAQPQADVELPAIQGADFAGGRDVRWTMRDVVLRRSDVHVTASAGVTFPDEISVSFSAGELSVVSRRGYAWADVIVNRHRLRFVSAHLDADSATYRALQAGALANALDSVRDRPVIVVGDLNSDPQDNIVLAPDPTPNNVAYHTLVGNGGFTDTWLAAAKRRGAGPTGWLSGALTDADTSALRLRIDHVLARPAAGGPPMRAHWARLTGLDRDARTPAGLWASDHAGVVTTLLFGK